MSREYLRGVNKRISMRAIYKSLCIFNILIFIINTALYIALAMGINRLYGTPGRDLSDYVVFYIAAMLAVYAFHGYDFHRPQEINRIIVSTAVGVIMAALVTIPFMIIFRPHMNKAAFTLLVAGTFFIASASRAAGAFCFRDKKATYFSFPTKDDAKTLQKMEMRLI